MAAWSSKGLPGPVLPSHLRPLASPTLSGGVGSPPLCALSHWWPVIPPPKKKCGPSQGTPEGRKHPFPPRPPRETRGEDPPGKGRSKGGQNRQGKQQAQGQTTGGSDKGHTETPGTSPTFPWMQDTPERLRLRLRWTPRPVPESSKPTLILLYAGKDDAGALDAYLHAYNPAFSEYIWAVDIRRKGGDLGQDMLGDEPFSTMCSMAMAGKVAFVRGGPNCRTWSILRWFPKPGGPPPMRGRAEQTLGLAWSPG